MGVGVGMAVGESTGEGVGMTVVSGSLDTRSGTHGARSQRIGIEARATLQSWKSHVEKTVNRNERRARSHRIRNEHNGRNNRQTDRQTGDRPKESDGDETGSQRTATKIDQKGEGETHGVNAQQMLRSFQGVHEHHHQVVSHQAMHIELDWGANGMQEGSSSRSCFAHKHQPEHITAFLSP